MYIFFIRKNYDQSTRSFYHPHDILWSDGTELPTSVPERTPFVGHPLFTDQFFTTDFRCDKIKEPRFQSSSERWEICKAVVHRCSWIMMVGKICVWSRHTASTAWQLRVFTFIYEHQPHKHINSQALHNFASGVKALDYSSGYKFPKIGIW